MIRDAAARVVLAGWYGRDNAGDEAILHQFLHELPPDEHLHLTVFAHDSARIHAQHGGPFLQAQQHHRLTGQAGLTHWLRGRVRPMLHALRSCDVFVLGGGSLIHDNSGLHSLLPVIDDIFIASHYGRPVWLYAVGIGPLRGKRARQLAGMALRRCAVITVRDTGSRALLLALGVDPARITVVHDPAFLLEPEPPPPARLARVEAAGPVAARIGVFLKHALPLDAAGRDRLAGWLAAELDALHAERGLRFVMLPMMTHPEDDDRRMARTVMNRMRHAAAVDVLAGMYGPEELAWWARAFRANICVRLHGAIFSLAGGTPTVGIEYDPKVGSLLRDLDMADLVVPMHDPAPGALVAAVGRMLAAEHAIRDRLRAELPAIRADAGRFFVMLRDRLGELRMKAS